MKKYNILLLVLFTCNITLYGAANDDSRIFAKPRYKRDVAAEIADATAKKAPGTIKKPARVGPPKYIPTAGKSSDRKNAQAEYTFLLKNEDINERSKEPSFIIWNSLNKVRCLVAYRLASAPKHTYNRQRYKIVDPKHELTGPLGSLLYRLNALNEKLINRQWVCSCISRSQLLQIKPEFGIGEIKTLIVPTDRSFDLTLERNQKDDSYHLTVYEAPDYQSPSEGFVHIQSS